MSPCRRSDVRFPRRRAARRQAWVRGEIAQRTRVVQAKPTARPAEGRAKPPRPVPAPQAADPPAVPDQAQTALDAFAGALRSRQSRVRAMRAAARRPAGRHHLYHHPARAVRAVPRRLHAAAARTASMAFLVGWAPADVAELHSV